MHGGGVAAIEPIRQFVQPILQQFFSLMSELDNERLVSTLEILIDKFPTEVAPAAPQMAQSIVRGLRCCGMDWLVEVGLGWVIGQSALPKSKPCRGWMARFEDSCARFFVLLLFWICE